MSKCHPGVGSLLLAFQDPNSTIETAVSKYHNGHMLRRNQTVTALDRNHGSGGPAAERCTGCDHLRYHGNIIITDTNFIYWPKMT